MSHITDGELHAYLDEALDAFALAEAERIRAHLETCADCGHRLEEERALHVRAAGILGGAVPGALPLASLEELEARAAATAGPTDRASKSRFSLRSPYAIGMGWAATIALALWTGYSVKDFAPDPSGRPPPPAELELMRELDAVSADNLARESDEKADRFRSAEVEAVAPGLMSSGKAVRTDAAGAGAPAEPGAEREPDQDLALNEERQRLRRAKAEEPARIDAAVRNEAAPVDQPPPPASTVFDDNLTLGVAGSVLDARKTLDQARSQEGAAALSGMLSITRARRTAGVPDLELLRIDRVELPGMGRVTLIVQILSNGGDLELWSLSASALAAASPSTDLEDRVVQITAYFKNSLPRGWSMVVREREGGYLVARAPLPQAELDALMEGMPEGD